MPAVTTKRTTKAQRKAEAEAIYPQQPLPEIPGQRTLFPPEPTEPEPEPEPEPDDDANNKDTVTEPPRRRWTPIPPAPRADSADPSWPHWCYVRDIWAAKRASEGLDRLDQLDRRVLTVVVQMVAQREPTGRNRVSRHVAQLQEQHPLELNKSVRRSLRILVEAGWLTPRPHGGPVPSEKLREAFRSARAAQGGQR